MENLIPQIISIIPPSFIIIVIALYFLGEIIKTTNIPNKYIVFILLFFSIIFCVLIGGFNPNSFLYAIIIAGLPTYFDNIVDQLLKVIKDQDE